MRLTKINKRKIKNIKKHKAHTINSPIYNKESKKSKTESSLKENKKRLVLWPIYLLFFIFLILYFIFEHEPDLSIIFGLTSFILLVLLLGFEITSSFKSEGYKKVIIEVFGTIIVVAVIWISLIYLLNTNYPINVVPSCSMRPALIRGDIIAIYGITNITQIKAPIVNVSSTEMNAILNPDYSDSLSCVAYTYINGSVHISQDYKSGWIIGLYKNYGGKEEILNNSNGYPISYNCGVRDMKYNNGTIGREAYLESITINNHTISGDANNSIVVYRTLPSDLFYKEGDSFIVHRAYVILNDSGKYYIATKGDNNPGLDMEYYNYPPEENQIVGKVIGKVPYLGYLKLIISGDFSPPAGCNSTVIHSWES